MCPFIRPAINTTQSLDKQGRRLIGRKSEKPAGLENFGFGNTIAHFHLEGNSEHVKIKLNKCVKAGKTTGSNILTNDNGIPSRPDASDFTAIKASKTSLGSTVINENTGTPNLTGISKSNSFWGQLRVTKNEFILSTSTSTSALFDSLITPN
jgi:hypothetical protein